MRIETVNINITNSQSSVARAFIESMLRSAEQDEPTPTVESAAASDIQAPQIGEYWKGQGGIYAGVCRGLNGEKDYPLILSIEMPTSELIGRTVLNQQTQSRQMVTKTFMSQQKKKAPFSTQI